MSDDIVEQLRAGAPWTHPVMNHGGVMLEAADEIETLRQALGLALQELEGLRHPCEALEEE